MDVRCLRLCFAAFLVAAACGGEELAITTRAVVAYPDCAELGQALVDHACFHAELGPFGDAVQPYPLVASAVTDFAATTPNVNAVHTFFAINLAGGAAGAHEGTVKYRPNRSGDWAILVTPDPPVPAPPANTAAPAVPAPPRPQVPIKVLSPAGTEVPVQLQHEVIGCPRLPRALVVKLTAGQTYRIVLGPTTVSHAGLVLEKLADFEGAVFRDGDGDGRGTAEATLVTACKPPAGYVATDDDCDDTKATVFPGANELCNGIDDDCDGMTDEGLPPATCGLGRCARAGATCSPTSCVPGAPAPEICNGTDDDCDGVTDDGLANATCGVGACARSGTSCNPSSCVPAAPITEICNGADDDCDGIVDEGCASSVDAAASPPDTSPPDSPAADAAAVVMGDASPDVVPDVTMVTPVDAMAAPPPDAPINSMRDGAAPDGHEPTGPGVDAGAMPDLAAPPADLAPAVLVDGPPRPFAVDAARAIDGAVDQANAAAPDRTSDAPAADAADAGVAADAAAGAQTGSGCACAVGRSSSSSSSGAGVPLILAVGLLALRRSRSNRWSR